MNSTKKREETTRARRGRIERRRHRRGKKGKRHNQYVKQKRTGERSNDECPRADSSHKSSSRLVATAKKEQNIKKKEPATLPEKESTL